MPEGRIDRRRLKDHFRRLWAAYLIGIVALFFLNHLVYVVTRPGYSDVETLKIMLLNVEIGLDEQALLEKARPLGFEAVEIVPLSIALEDPTSEMLLKVQLVGGYGDIYITDANGLQALQERDACGSVREMASGMVLVVAKNGTNVESAAAALDVLEAEMEMNQHETDR